MNRFGLEGLVTFKKPIAFDPENYNITVDSLKGEKITIGVFDKVKVKISVDKVRVVLWTRNELWANICM